MVQAIMANRIATKLNLSPSPHLSSIRNPKLISFSSSPTLRIESRPKLGFSVGVRRRTGGGGSSGVVSASVAAVEKPSTVPEIVLQPIKDISGTVKLPGSKSLSNRILPPF